MIGIFVKALADGCGYHIVYRHGTSQQVVSVAADPGPVQFRKRPTKSRNVGCGALDEPRSKSDGAEKRARPKLSDYYGTAPWKSLKLRTRYFGNSYHSGAARSKKPNRSPAKHKTI
jgi:hypothetical protein